MAKKIYLSPSEQPDHVYSYGNTNEKAACCEIATFAEKATNVGSLILYAFGTLYKSVILRSINTQVFYYELVCTCYRLYGQNFNPFFI